MGYSYVHGVSKRLMRQYDVLKELGSGAFGTVYLIRNSAGRYYAMKVIEHAPDGELYREIAVMKTLSHPNITRLLDFSQNETHVNLIMDYMGGGTLQERIDDEGRLSEHIARLYFLQMCKAIEYLHSRRITHHDLKPDNILLSCQKGRKYLKVTDFGISKENFDYYSYSRCGTKLFMAPEYWTAKHHNYKVDIWALGVILFYCLCGELPFDDEHEICNISCSFNQYAWNSVTSDPKRLIKRLLLRNYHHRPNIHFALNTAWLKDHNLQQTYNNLIN